MTIQVPFSLQIMFGKRDRKITINKDKYSREKIRLPWVLLKVEELMATMNAADEGTTTACPMELLALLTASINVGYRINRHLIYGHCMGTLTPGSGGRINHVEVE